MADDAEEMIAFRLGPKDRAAIQRLVQSGEFRNRSDFLRYAVKIALKEADLRRTPAAPPVDLDFEGVELPEHAPARPRAGHRARKGVKL